MMHMRDDSHGRRAQYLAMASYACSKALYSAKAEDRLYWQGCGRFWKHLAAQVQAAKPPAPLASVEPPAEAPAFL